MIIGTFYMLISSPYLTLTSRVFVLGFTSISLNTTLSTIATVYTLHGVKFVVSAWLLIFVHHGGYRQRSSNISFTAVHSLIDMYFYHAFIKCHSQNASVVDSNTSVSCHIGNTYSLYVTLMLYFCKTRCFISQSSCFTYFKHPLFALPC